MAGAKLPAPVAEGDRLYSAWRYARAEWELAIHDPANCGADLPGDVGAMHCDAEHGALIAFLLHPADNLGDLSRKLRVFREEAGFEFAEAGEIVAALAADAYDFAFEAECRRNAGRASRP